MSLETCDSGHDMVAYSESVRCPVCVEQEKLVDVRNKLQEQIDYLGDQLEALAS